jgi:hypothetical protein
MSTGEIIINAVIRAAAVESAVITEGGTVFVWATNAAEQIEAAIAEAGYELRPNASAMPTASEGRPQT